MAAPAITITGKLQDVFGGASLLGKLRCALRGFGSNQPRIVGTSILVDTDVEVVMPGDGTFSFAIWGVDVITPGPTVCYYEISFEPAAGGVIKTILYQPTGSGSFDLSSLTPFNGIVTPPAPANAVVTNPPGGGQQNIDGDVGLERLIGVGAPVVAGDFVLSAEWGSTAVVLSVSGTDLAGMVAFKCQGAGIAQFPHIRFTFHDGPFAQAPTVLAQRQSIGAPSNANIVPNAPTVAHVDFYFSDTPQTGVQYEFSWVTIG